MPGYQRWNSRGESTWDIWLFLQLWLTPFQCLAQSPGQGSDGIECFLSSWNDLVGWESETVFSSISKLKSVGILNSSSTLGPIIRALEIVLNNYFLSYFEYFPSLGSETYLLQQSKASRGLCPFYISFQTWPPGLAFLWHPQSSGHCNQLASLSQNPKAPTSFGSRNGT